MEGMAIEFFKWRINCEGYKFFRQRKNDKTNFLVIN